MPSSMQEGSLADCRVLVVEDEYFIADDIARILQRAGAEIVGPAPTRDKALALLASEQVDAAVLDINLHGEPVYPVAAALTARGTPFVFATGYDKKSIPPEYQDIPLWEKPFDPARFAQVIPGLVRQS